MSSSIIPVSAVVKPKKEVELTFADTPHWRYDLAQADYLAYTHKDKTHPFSDDVAVQLLVKFMQTFNSPRVGTKKCMQCMPPGLPLVYSIFTQPMSASSYRFALEAAILGNASAEFVKENIHPGFNRLLFDLYKMWFFDIDDKREHRFWVERYVLVPARNVPNTFFWSSYVWKVIAYTSDAATMLDKCMQGRLYEDKDVEWVKKHITSEYMRNALQTVHSGDKVSKDQMYAAHRHKSVEDVVKPALGGPKPEETGTSTAKDLLEGVGKRMRMAPSIVSGADKKETITGIAMYDKSDLEE